MTSHPSAFRSSVCPPKTNSPLLIVLDIGLTPFCFVWCSKKNQKTILFVLGSNNLTFSPAYYGINAGSWMPDFEQVVYFVFILRHSWSGTVWLCCSLCQSMNARVCKWITRSYSTGVWTAKVWTTNPFQLRLFKLRHCRSMNGYFGFAEAAEVGVIQVAGESVLLFEAVCLLQPLRTKMKTATS